MTTDAMQVTQAAREDRAAAKDCAPFWAGTFNHYGEKTDSERWANYWSGKYDHLRHIQAFARHREATTATLTAQVEALTAERDALREALEYISKHSFGAAYGGDHVSCYECLHTHEKARAALASTKRDIGESE